MLALESLILNKIAENIDIEIKNKNEYINEIENQYKKEIKNLTEENLNLKNENFEYKKEIIEYLNKINEKENKGIFNKSNIYIS